MSIPSTTTRPTSSTTSPSRSSTGGVLARLTRPVLWVDAVGSAAIGAGLAFAPGSLASGLGVSSTSVRLLGALFVLNAWVVARPLLEASRDRFLTTGVVDVVFAVAVAAAVFALPSGAAGWAPWLLAGVALLSVDLAAVKLLAARRAR